MFTVPGAPAHLWAAAFRHAAIVHNLNMTKRAGKEPAHYTWWQKFPKMKYIYPFKMKFITQYETIFLFKI